MAPKVKRTRPSFNSMDSILPVVKLNNLYPGLRTRWTKEGPPHDPLFTIKYFVGGKTFVGKGKSKKLAKHKAALNAIENLSEIGKQKQSPLIKNSPSKSEPNAFMRALDISKQKPSPLIKGSPTKSQPASLKLADIGKQKPSPLIKGPAESQPNDFMRAVDVDKQKPPPLPIKRSHAKSRRKAFVKFSVNGKRKKPQLLKNSPAKLHLNGHFNSQSSKNNSGSFIPPPNSSRNALAIVNELRPGLQWKYVSKADQMTMMFFTSVTINGERFTGSGVSKKAARLAAASAYLAKISALQKPKCGLQSKPGKVQRLPRNVLTEHLADTIERAVMNKFFSVTSRNLTLKKYKVLAGIIMTRGNSYGNLEVVSLGAGIKCINGRNLSLSGSSVNDCHAEILARRALLSFFYHHLLLLSKPGTSNSSIFENCVDSEGYQLKEGINFFLYITTSPCGDGRVFSMGKEEAALLDNHPNRINRGLLRTKIEGGEGTVWLDENRKVQTWDGIAEGERLLTMSCSDKIAKWNAVGLQGALLSHFIKPIYLTGIVVKRNFNEAHIHRAVAGRLEGKLDALPSGYRLNKPLLATTSCSIERQAVNGPNHAVFWSAEMPDVGALNAVTGKELKTEKISSISKRKLFEKFLRLIGKVSTISNVNNLSKSSALTVYAKAKLAATQYQEAKKETFQAFSRANLGDWLKKPAEMDEFIVKDLRSN